MSAAKVVAFVKANPGCTVTGIRDGCGLADAAEAWDLIVDAERAGHIFGQRINQQPWHFYVTEAEK